MKNTDEFHNNPEQKKKVTKNVNTISHSKSSLKGKILYGDSHLRGKNTKKYEKVITIIKTVDTSRVRKKSMIREKVLLGCQKYSVSPPGL